MNTLQEQQRERPDRGKVSHPPGAGLLRGLYSASIALHISALMTAPALASPEGTTIWTKVQDIM